MDSSLDKIVPSSIFEQPNWSGQASPISPVLARQVVEVILTQLRTGIDASSQEVIDALQRRADEEVLQLLHASSVPATSLHRFVTTMLLLSKDPRKTPIAFRLFGIAAGIDPMQLPDPTGSASSSGLDTSLSAIPLAGKDAWGLNAAAYSWASMVLSGQSPPPPGIHLLQKGSSDYIAAVARQQAAAVRVYATLAMRGDPQGMLGMGRVLMAGTQRDVPVPGKTGAESGKEVAMMRDRTIALWTKAGQMGVGDAWFELGLLYLGTVKGMGTDEAKARSYFELGAKEGNVRSHHALGVLHMQAAMADNRSPSPPERADNLSKSLQHFTAAAEQNEPQSAHNLGLRFLLRDEMVNEIALGSDKDGRSAQQVLEQARKRHQDLWGVQPDDVEARKWFAKAAELGSIPAMLNYAGMLVEMRGRDGEAGVPFSSPVTSQEESGRALIQSRLNDLKRAESLYSSVAARASVLGQQTQATASNQGAKVDDAGKEKKVDAGKEMTTFAQEALGTVQAMMEQLTGQLQGSSDQKTTQQG